MLIDDDAGFIAQDIVNPVSPIFRLPGVAGYDGSVGPDKGYKIGLRLKPVLPIKLNNRYHLVNRIEVPFVRQNNIYSTNSGRQTGLGDIAYTAFVAPTEPGSDRWLWCMGPSLSLPTASKDALGMGQMGIGPAALLVRPGVHTVGLMLSHLWFGKERVGRAQPFYAKVWEDGTTFNTGIDLTNNWSSKSVTGLWEVGMGKVFRLGAQYGYGQTGPVLGFGTRAGRPAWGWRLGLGLVW